MHELKWHKNRKYYKRDFPEDSIDILHYGVIPPSSMPTLCTKVHVPKKNHLAADHLLALDQPYHCVPPAKVAPININSLPIYLAMGCWSVVGGIDVGAAHDHTKVVTTRER